MKKNAIVVTMAALKGGTGKSTSTSILANYIHEVIKKKVLVIDADFEQPTLWRMRQRDIRNGYEEAKLYDLIKMDPWDFPKNYNVVKNEYDIIIIDLPGNIVQEGIKTCYALVDKIFMPTELSFHDSDSNYLLLKKYSEEIKPYIDNIVEKTGIEHPQDIVIYPNRINPRVKEYKAYKENNLLAILSVMEASKEESEEFIMLCKELNVRFLKNCITYNEVAFKREASTVELYKKASGDDMDIKAFCKEMYELIIK